jgi:hypothetical protein
MMNLMLVKIARARYQTTRIPIAWATGKSLNNELMLLE